MKLLISMIAGAAFLTALPAGAAQVSAAAPTIPARFHGQWASNARACQHTGPMTTIVTLNGGGWSSWEEGARVVRRGPVRSGTHHFGTRRFGGPDAHPGSLAVRLAGSRLAMSETVLGQTTHRMLVRCR